MMGKEQGFPLSGCLGSLETIGMSAVFNVSEHGMEGIHILLLDTLQVQ